MKILEFIKSLLPRFNKSSVLEDLRVTAAELDNNVIPSYRVAADHFKINKFKSEVIKALSIKFYKDFDVVGGKKANIVEEIYKRLPTIKENLEYVNAQIEELLEKDILKEGLTARKAILMRAADAFSFTSRYSLDLLNYIYVHESMEYGTDVEETLELSPAVLKHVENNFLKYVRLLSDYSVTNSDFVKILSGVPDVVVNEKTKNALVGHFKESDLDPLSKGHIAGFAYNPFFMYGKYQAEAQAARYKADKDKKKLLELRLLHLKMLQEDKNDPKLEQEIEYLQSRIDKIARQLQDIEATLT